MKKTLVIILYLVVSTLIYSQDNVVIERSSFILNLNVDETNYWEWTVPQTPYILNENIIQFYPGETLYVEADVINDIIVKLTVVKEIINKNKTIVIEFNQITNKENPRVHEYMMLKIINPFDKILEYKAGIYLLKYNQWINTSTIPIRAGLMSFESWPDIISTMVLHDFILK